MGRFVPLQPHMIPCMISDLVALLRHSAYQILIPRQLFPHQKKRSAGPPLPQSVQKAGCRTPPGAVVKGQRHIAGFARRNFSRSGSRDPRDLRRGFQKNQQNQIDKYGQQLLHSDSRILPVFRNSLCEQPQNTAVKIMKKDKQGRTDGSALLLQI